MNALEKMYFYQYISSIIESNISRLLSLQEDLQEAKANLESNPDNDWKKDQFINAQAKVTAQEKVLEILNKL